MEKILEKTVSNSFQTVIEFLAKVMSGPFRLQGRALRVFQKNLHASLRSGCIFLKKPCIRRNTH
jgi:hypothetical protein